jgi:ribosomal protein S18 acetylase RimI-like enzyme
MSLHIRRANRNDAEILALLGRITFAETFGPLFAAHPDDLAAYLDRTFSVLKLRASLERAHNAYWLGLVDALPVAYAKLKYPSPSVILPDPAPAQLQKIYVLREFVGKGMGKPLLRAVFEHAADRGIPALWLDVLRENARAIRFYQHTGFTAVGDDTYSIGAQTFHFHLMARRFAPAPPEALHAT